MAVAAAVFARRGYAAATVQDVADELGILKGSIYYYIKTKEDLLYRLMIEVHNDVDALVEEVEARGALNSLERIAAYARVQMTYNLNNLVRISVYYNDLDQLSGERRQEVLRWRRGHEDLLTALVVDAQREGLIDASRDARLLTYSIFAALVWPYRWFRPHGRVTVENVVESSVAFVLGGLAGD